MRNRPKFFALVFLLLTALWLVGCDRGSHLSADITRAESKWLSQGINSYTIEVSHTSGTWHHQMHIITVLDGEVVDTTGSCVDAPMETALNMNCEVQAYDPEDYTVPGLFKLAWAHFEHFPTQNIEIEFDPDYGYPTLILYDDPEIVDEDQVWNVRSFEVIKD